MKSIYTGLVHCTGFVTSPHYLELQGSKIAYDDTGSDPLVICAPSLGDLRVKYRFLSPQIASTGYLMIRMDSCGQGGTSTLWPDYSVGTVGSDLIALIRSLDSGPAVIFGTLTAPETHDRIRTNPKLHW